MKTIYADSLFFLNAIVNYLVLLAAGRLCALPLRRGRMALSAALGGIYAVLASVWPQLFALPAAKLLSGALMALAAFGLHRQTPRAVIAVYTVSAAFAGTIYAAARLSGQSPEAARFVPVSIRTLLLSFALCYAVISLAFRRTLRCSARTLCPVGVTLMGSTVSFTALVDSGNELLDPISGDRVLIAEAESLAPLFPDSAPLLLGDPSEALEALAAQGVRCRLLPFSCVSAETSLLLCFRPDEVRVVGQRQQLLIGISPGRLTADGGYQAILPQ